MCTQPVSQQAAFFFKFLAIWVIGEFPAVWVIGKNYFPWTESLAKIIYRMLSALLKNLPKIQDFFTMAEYLLKYFQWALKNISHKLSIRQKIFFTLNVHKQKQNLIFKKHISACINAYGSKSDHQQLKILIFLLKNYPTLNKR